MKLGELKRKLEWLDDETELKVYVRESGFGVITVPGSCEVFESDGYDDFTLIEFYPKED